jgi:hypothetical protein
MDVAAVSTPTEPEQTASEQDTADHADGQAPFGHRDVVVRFEFLDVTRVIKDDECEGDHFSDDHTEVGQACNTRRPAVHALEDEGIRCEKEVKKAICGLVSCGT